MSEPNEKRGRRAREYDAERKALQERERVLLREAVKEFEARLPEVVKNTLVIAGIEDSVRHRRDHMETMPKIQDVVMPWVEHQLELAKENLRIKKKIKDSIVAWVVGGAMLFVSLCIYYGATLALEHMVKHSG